MFRFYIASLLTLSIASHIHANPEDMFRLSIKMWQECNTNNEELISCLQSKVVSAMDRAARAEYIPLWDSVSFVRSAEHAGANRADFARALSENDLAEARKHGRLQDLLWDRLAHFLSSHTIKIDLPRLSPEDVKAGVEEGRGKMKKMMGMMVMGGAMKLMALVPIAIGMLFILAGKALILAKVALILTMLMTLKKILTSKTDDGGWQGAGGGHGGGGYDRRTLDSHYLAYSGYKP